MIGITSSFAVTSFLKIQARSQARGAIESVVVALHRTRSEAVSHNRELGVYIETDNSNTFVDRGVSRNGLRYLRFAESDAGIAGAFDPTDTIIEPFTPLEGKAFAYSMSSGGMSVGGVSIVFHSEGSADNDLRMNMGIPSFKDTFHLSLLPATGLATLER